MYGQKDFASLVAGEKLLHFCLIKKVEVKSSKTGKSYLNLELQDQSATLPAKMWSGFDDFVDSLKTGVVIKAGGKVDEYMGQLQLVVDKIRVAEKSDNVTSEDFLPRSARDIDVMVSELNEKIDSITNVYLKKLLDQMLSKEAFEKYIRVPAGKSWHHSYIHGLLEHTLEIVRICELLCEFHKEINKDLLLTGAILHDFGKTEELSYENSFDYTLKGKLLGHIVIAASKAEKIIDKIPGFPEELKFQVMHLILSHQGKLEYASPVEPKTLEAIILYHADELSAKANAYKNAIINERSSGSGWTRYLPLAGTDLFIPNEAKEDSKTTLFD